MIADASTGPMTRDRALRARASALLLAAALMWPLRGYLTDDTFIHLQYAQHLGQRAGAGVQPGRARLRLHQPAVGGADRRRHGARPRRAAGRARARLRSRRSPRSCCSCSSCAARCARRELRAAATVAWAGHAWMLRWSLSGMETPLAVALVLAGFVAFTEGQQWGARPVRTGALWALAALTRPEAVFLLLLWGVFLLIDADSRAGLRRLVFGALPPVVIYGGWLLFARSYFGTFWPQTLSAKIGGRGGLAVQLENLWRQVQIVGATDGVMAALLVAALVFGGRAHVAGAAARAAAAAVGVGAARCRRSTSRAACRCCRATCCRCCRCSRGSRGARPSAGGWARRPTPRRVRRARALRGAGSRALVLAQNLAGLPRHRCVPHVHVVHARDCSRASCRWGEWFRANTPAGRARSPRPTSARSATSATAACVDLAGPRHARRWCRCSSARTAARETRSRTSRSRRSRGPSYLVDRGAAADDLLARSPYARGAGAARACLGAQPRDRAPRARCLHASTASTGRRTTRCARPALSAPCSLARRPLHARAAARRFFRLRPRFSFDSAARRGLLCRARWGDCGE